jgi:toluene monooxygenase system protein E
VSRPAGRPASRNGSVGEASHRCTENLLIQYDWGHAFAALDLAVKPAIDELLNAQFAELAKRNGDELLSNLFIALRADSERSRDWTSALVSYATERDASLVGLLDGWKADWQPRAIAAMEPLAAMFERAPVPMAASEVMGAVRAAVEAAGEPRA